MKKFLLLSLVSASFISLSSNKDLQPKEENNGIIRLVSRVTGDAIGQGIEHGIKYVTGFDAENFGIKSNVIRELK